MKKIMFTIVTALVGFTALACQHGARESGGKPKCVGYSVLEVGKAIDCNGDTIRLTKRNGFYQLASN
jgi:hypothetical protein